ncbi:MAG: hypothetical protein QXT43_01170 [Candidatus Micrarchaeaceae archaeon]
MPVKDIIEKISTDYEKQAMAIIESANAEAKRIKESAREGAKAKAKEIEENARKEAAMRKQLLEQGIAAEEHSLISSAFDSAVERATKHILALLAAELQKHKEQIVESAIKHFARAVQKGSVVAFAEKAYSGIVKQNGIALKGETEHGLLLQSSDSRISMRVSIAAIAESGRDIAESLAAKELKKKVLL